jgi:hypothetical protein
LAQKSVRCLEKIAAGKHLFLPCREEAFSVHAVARSAILCGKISISKCPVGTCHKDSDSNALLSQKTPPEKRVLQKKERAEKL